MSRRRGTAPAVWAALCCGALTILPTLTALADTGTSGAGVLPRTASASLDFNIAIGKLLFFRIGPASAYPATSTAQSSLLFQLAPSIPAVPTPPVTGNNQPVNWSGAAPSFAVTSAAQVLPVEVRSNAGTVSLNASATAPLSNGSTTIPLSEILISSSSTGLPAPGVPAAGNGASVAATGTAYGTLVTVRSADWTFSYANSALRPAGTYAGQITFTASTPCNGACRARKRRHP